MRKIIQFIFLMLNAQLLLAQHIYQIRADSVRIYNVCDTAELIIENRTRGISGFLHNKGNGRTEFQRIQLESIGNGKIAILGQDTLDLSTLPGISGIDTIYRAGDSIRYVDRGIIHSIYAPLAGSGDYVTRTATTVLPSNASAFQGNLRDVTGASISYVLGATNSPTTSGILYTGTGPSAGMGIWGYQLYGSLVGGADQFYYRLYNNSESSTWLKVASTEWVTANFAPSQGSDNYANMQNSFSRRQAGSIFIDGQFNTNNAIIIQKDPVTDGETSFAQFNTANTKGFSLSLGATANSGLNIRVGEGAIVRRLGIALNGEISINNIPTLSTSATRFLTVDGEVLKSRTNAQVLTDIGAAPITLGTGYIQNQTTAAQTASSWVTGAHTASRFQARNASGTGGFELANASGQIKWAIQGIDTETAADTGYNFIIYRGSSIRALLINRSSGAATFYNDLTANGVLTMANASKVKGSSTAGPTQFQSILQFMASNNTTRDGYVGNPGGSGRNITLAADAGPVNIVSGPSGANINLNATGTVTLSNDVRNTLVYNNIGLATPSFSSRSIGTKLVFRSGIASNMAEYAMGVDSTNIWSTVPQHNSTYGFKWYGGTTQLARLDGSGELIVNGGITATAVTQTSRRELKKNIHAFNASALSILAKAQVRNFQFRADSTGRVNIGFIADEVPDEMSVPGRTGVDQTGTVALLVKAVQELNEENNTLKKELEELKVLMKQIISKNP